MNKLLALALFAPPLAVACAGSETGNGVDLRKKRPVAIEMKLEAPAGRELAFVDSSGTSFEIDSALAVVERIDLVLADGDSCTSSSGIKLIESCSGGDRLRLEGPWLVDLVSGELSPPLEGVDLLQGGYEALDLRFSSQDDACLDEACHALDGFSLDVSGSVALDGTTRPYELALDITVFARARDEAGLVEVGEDTSALGIIFGVDQWFSSLDLGRCITQGAVPTVDGVLRLEGAERRACGDVTSAVRHALAETGVARAKGNNRDAR